MRFLIILLFTILGSTPALASVSASKITNHFNFYLEREFGFGVVVEYRCFDVEWDVQNFMRSLGARNVRVFCSGGYPGYFTSLQMTYETLRQASSNDPSPVQADWKRVHVNSFDNCFLLQQVFRQVRRTFEIKDIWEPGQCFQPDSHFNMNMTTLFPVAN